MGQSSPRTWEVRSSNPAYSILFRIRGSIRGRSRPMLATIGWQPSDQADVSNKSVRTSNPGSYSQEATYSVHYTHCIMQKIEIKMEVE